MVPLRHRLAIAAAIKGSRDRYPGRRPGDRTRFAVRQADATANFCT
jgi:hypothetical protein